MTIANLSQEIIVPRETELTSTQKTFIKSLIDDPKKLELLMAWMEPWSTENELRAKKALELKANECAQTLAINSIINKSSPKKARDCIKTNAKEVTILNLSISHLKSVVPQNKLQKIKIAYKNNSTEITQRLETIIRKLPSLVSLNLSGTPISTVTSGVLPKTLRFLHISDCPNLKDLDQLHLEALPALQKLTISTLSAEQKNTLQKFKNLQIIEISENS